MFARTALGLVAAFSLCAGEGIADEAEGGLMGGLLEMTLPAMLLVQTSDGAEELLTGDLRGNANGNASFSVAGPTYGVCQGNSLASGPTVMTCENGFALERDVGRRSPRMSGTFVLSGDWQGLGYTGVLGWGRDANEDALRAALASGG